MEIKLFFKNGDLESHVLPEYSGRTVTRREGDEKRTDVVTTELDVLTDVVETLQVRDSGVFLSRRICVNEDARRRLGVEVTRRVCGEDPHPVGREDARAGARRRERRGRMAARVGGHRGRD